MKPSVNPANQIGLQEARLPLLERLFRRGLESSLSGLHSGQINLVDGDRSVQFGLVTPDFPVHSVVRVHDPGFYANLALGGSIGAAESYMMGQWSTDDLTGLIRLMVRNRDVLDGMESGLAKLSAPFRRVFHRFRRNDRSGSRKNILAHYDLGNDFYSLFLDESMTYSCGVFPDETSSLHEASITKIDRVCRKLDLHPSDHLVEIGTGWGALSIHAARNYGCRVTTTTISEEQFAFAEKRIAKAGLSEKITVVLLDYRDLEGQFDKLVSVEMIEAVGDEYLDDYFGACSRLLKPEGLMAIQAIVMNDQHYDEYRKGVDFIQRYIFPGSCLPSMKRMLEATSRATDLRLTHMEDITPHYPRTLRAWRERFFERIEEVRALGFSDAFIRMWEFYLCYCEGGFLERYIGDVQLLFAKPLNRVETLLPDLTKDRGLAEI